MNNKITIAEIRAMKKAGEKITMLTAYDSGFAGILDQCGLDMVLVGDSLGMVALGYDSTIPVTMEEMLHHARAVSRKVSRAVLVGDMPFLSYQTGIHDALINAGRFMKEAGCDAVKLEGGVEMCEIVAALVRAGIPVMGHIGLTPQTASQLGGYKVQGRDRESAIRMLADAKALDAAGVFAIVLECIPDKLAAALTGVVNVPTIGIGAGASCDGQVLVTHDLLGIFDKKIPSFVKRYANMAPLIKEAIASYHKEVKSGDFPDNDHSFQMQIDIESLLDDADKPDL
ncbi:MAG: 3-methyl-2-oxobutanoate hydroxymethyltransferase [Proteobacteria bacterium]|nr:3-methyl-2-oxobutanoate hydroxymethyltransferase [Pseudomonadota bacterium]MBU1710555.1 3-methyl-2-oxobutanoate hydroxymethyltransferase [Pseudomonadota bacterium]